SDRVGTRIFRALWRQAMRTVVLAILLTLAVPVAALAECATTGCVTPPDRLERKMQACSGRTCVIPKLVILRKPHDICITCDVPSWTRTTVDKYARWSNVGSDRRWWLY